MIEGLSDTLQRQIEQFKIACNIYDDLSSMWAQLQTSEQSNPQIDTVSMRNLTEHHLMRRISQYHNIRADLSGNILQQAIRDGVFTLKKSKTFSNSELIGTATAFIDATEKKTRLGHFIDNLFGGTTHD